MSTETSLSETVEAAKQLAARFPEIPGGKRWEIFREEFDGEFIFGSRQFLLVYLTPKEQETLNNEPGYLFCLLDFQSQPKENTDSPCTLDPAYPLRITRNHIECLEQALTTLTTTGNTP